jgi:pyruvate dehydrogenase E2 component (dihydrolipoamide acetyltransferase)
VPERQFRLSRLVNHATAGDEHDSGSKCGIACPSNPYKLHNEVSAIRVSSQGIPMIYQVVVPDLGATGDGMKLTAWMVKPNDFVRSGSPLFAVTTDKADVEVEAFRDGYIRKILVDADSSVTLGTVVAVLADSLDESVADSSQHGTAGSPFRCQKEFAKGHGSDASEQANSSSESGRVLASPLARRIAQERGIDLGSVRSASEEGKIHKRDILTAAPRPEDHRQTAELESQNRRVARRVPLARMRKAIAERTTRSKADVPHFYVTAVVDVSDVLEFLKHAAALSHEKGWSKPSLTDVVLRAAAMALQLSPQLNASFQGDEIVYFEDVHIGLVVALAEGVMVPVIANADRMDLYALAATRRQLQEKTMAGKLSEAELTGSTFTISNLGKYGVENFVAVINPPEAAILAVGSAKKRPSMWGGQIVPRVEMMVTLSVDHRLVDGVAAARFLNEFKNTIENPLKLALDGHSIHSK